MNESAKNNFALFETNFYSYFGTWDLPNTMKSSWKVRLIRTRFQPSDELTTDVAQPFQRFTFSRANPKTVETVRTSKGKLDHPVETR
jgi:hypothetical protein